MWNYSPTNSFEPGNATRLGASPPILPEPVLENEYFHFYWDRHIQTDLPVEHNCSDIILWDKRSRRVKIIDITVPLDKNIKLIYTTKIQKYIQLKDKITEIWGVKSTTVHPIVISAAGNVHVRFVNQLRDLDVARVLAAV